ncbi:uroporphyrinogen-III C-methyltransferase [Noviherbaspirillum aerium]|uniref:uroporphyrinogen-III C-methyltransferase n=1 Tax=Noviherbaspirillum aerium TaxID=2588497 RepID=UPI00178C4888
MNELPSSDSGASASTNSTARPDVVMQPAPVRGDSAARVEQVRKLVFAGLGGLALLLLAQWWASQREISGLREELALRLKTGDSLATETRVMAKSSQDTIRELQAKVNVLESRQTESQSQQLALEQLYQELNRNRDDWALAEIEQVLSTASQQLQLAGNVQGAVIALQNADNRLSRSDKPQFIVIRRAIAKDLERLKALPAVDLTGIALRLDSIIGQIDSMPLLSDEKPVVSASQPRTSRRTQQASGTSAGGNGGTDWIASLENVWNSWTSEMWSEVRQLIQVRHVDSPDALLLSPSQSYYARENLKLRLLNARLALLTRNEAAFRSDLIGAQDSIARFFDTRAKQTQTTQALLRQVQASNLSIEMPTLADSLNAVRNYKAKP